MVTFVRRSNYALLLYRRQTVLSAVKKPIERFYSLKSESVTSEQRRDRFYFTMTSSSSLSILNSHYDRIVEDLCSYYSSESSHNTYLQKTLSHFKYVVSYNIVDGKKIRGTAVIDTVRALSSHSTDAKLLENAAVLGWCIELMQGAFLVADDIMDHSTTRRGKPCWYLNIKEKETAVNDAFYLYSCTFTLLKKYFPTQVQLFHLFNEVFQRTVIGQGLDLETPSYLPSIDLYTEEHYFTVVTWKTAYYTILLPIICGLLITPSWSSLVDHPETKPILIDIGNCFQVQDDYLDCYGDVSQTGKIGTDIQERKCSWLIVQAVRISGEKSNERAILRENYGFDDEAKVQLVKGVYDKLNLKQVFRDYEERTFAKIFQRIDRAQFNSPEFEDLLKQVLNSLHSRGK